MSLEDHQIRRLAVQNGYRAEKRRDEHLWTLEHQETGHRVTGMTGIEVRGVLAGTRSLSGGQRRGFATT